jgi:hypothetical protein
MLAYLKRVGLSLSILLNVILGGEANQPFSARQWDRKRKKLYNIAYIIDLVFLLVAYVVNCLVVNKIDLSNHCMDSWINWQAKINREHNV